MALSLNLIDRAARWCTRQDTLAFVLTNYLPRRAATHFMGWFSRIEHPFVRDLSIRLLQAFAGDLRLHEAARTTFTSLHDCFVRELKPGARPVDASSSILVSPCDGIVGALGAIEDGTCVQAKGFTYTLQDLLCQPELAGLYRHGTYITLRLTPAMYHHFHAPCDCTVDEVVYVSGDTWNVHPATLRRVPRVFCRNERAIVPLTLPSGERDITLVAVAAILVASIRLTFLDMPLTLAHRGVSRLACDARFAKGQTMGHFHHGSTIIVLARPGFTLCESVREGVTLRMGQPLLHTP